MELQNQQINAAEGNLSEEIIHSDNGTCDATSGVGSTNTLEQEKLFEYSIENLINEEKEKIFLLYEEVSKIPSLQIANGKKFPHWLTIGTLYRYLVGRKWNVNDALNAIKATIDWRNSNKIDEFTADSEVIASNRKYKGSYCIGRGKENEVICYICPVYNPNSFEDKRLYSIWMMEEALHAVQEPKQKKMIWILDFSSFQGDDEEHSKKDKDRRKLSRESMKMVMDHYPETMKRMYFVNPPFFFRVLWKFLSLFIERSTYEKIKIITGQNVTPELLEAIPEDQLDRKYGGKMEITDAMKENWHLFLTNDSSEEQMD